MGLPLYSSDISHKEESIRTRPMDDPERIRLGISDNLKNTKFMNYQDFICSCIGIPSDICNLLDKIEAKFHTDEIYDMEEKYIKVLVHEYGMENGFTVGNMLIMKLFSLIIDQYVESYGTDYPEFTESLFKPWVNGYDSELWFNDKKVEDKEQLDQAVEEWILKTQKK